MRSFFQNTINLCIFLLLLSNCATAFAQQDLGIESLQIELFEDQASDNITLLEPDDFLTKIENILVDTEPSPATDISELTDQYLEYVPLNRGVGTQPFQVVSGEDVVSEVSLLPPSPERDRILDAASSSNGCSIAAGDYAFKLGALGGFNPLNSLSDIINSAKADDFVKFLSLINDYDGKCLSNQSSLPEEIMTAGLGSSVAVITLDDNPVCGALRIGDREYLTARHCFFDPQNGQPIRTAQEIKIHVLEDNFNRAGNGLKLEIDNALPPDNIGPFDISEDYVTVTIDRGLGTFVPFETDLLSPHGELVLVGYFRFHDISGLTQNTNGSVSDPNWRKGVRWTDSPLCTFFDTQSICKAHFCQTDSRFSGSPIFSKNLNDGKPVFRGLHISAMGAAPNCGFEWVKNTGNIAINKDK